MNDIYSWGRNYWGQLGRGIESGMLECLKPEYNKYLADKNIIDISVQIDHCLALSSDGQVYGWGDNHHGQINNSNQKQIKLKKQ